VQGLRGLENAVTIVVGPYIFDGFYKMHQRADRKFLISDPAGQELH
jgi:hypothetical protein